MKEREPEMFSLHRYKDVPGISHAQAKSGDLLMYLGPGKTQKYKFRNLRTGRIIYLFTLETTVPEKR